MSNSKNTFSHSPSNTTFFSPTPFVCYFLFLCYHSLLSHITLPLLLLISSLFVFSWGLSTCRLYMGQGCVYVFLMFCIQEIHLLFREMVVSTTKVDLQKKKKKKKRSNGAKKEIVKKNIEKAKKKKEKKRNTIKKEPWETSS